MQHIAASRWQCHEQFVDGVRTKRIIDQRIATRLPFLPVLRKPALLIGHENIMYIIPAETLRYEPQGQVALMRDGAMH